MKMSEAGSWRLAARLNRLPVMVLLVCLMPVLSGMVPEAEAAAPPSDVTLVVDTSHSLGKIDLTRYALGQGGLSDKPMIGGVVDQIANLHPQTIRLFVQSYYRIYPAHGRYHWDTLDKAIETILATGAKPIMCLTFKPKVLYPKIDQKVVYPTSWKEWDELIYELVKHCNLDRKFGIQYWEVGNEVNIGEEGGAPYLFTPQEYLVYYTHTANAILRADPDAKVGGPALAGYKSPILDALVQYCGSGKAPLNFVSWHIYDSDPKVFRQSIEEVKAKLMKYPSLKGVETVLDEWNMSLSNPDLNPYFQPAFIMEVTRDFYLEGLTRSGYYHIRDYFVDPKNFTISDPEAWADLMAHGWNDDPQYDGLYDNQGRVRPAYYALELLSFIKGERLAVKGLNSDVKGFAARNGQFTEVVIWNFPSGKEKAAHSVTVQFPFEQKGEFQVAKLNPLTAVNNIEVVRHEGISNLKKDPIRINLRPYDIYWIELEPPGW